MARRRKDMARRDTVSGNYSLSRLTRAIRAITRAPAERPNRQLKFEALEPRVLLSADPFTAALAGTAVQDWSQQAETLELSPDAIAGLTDILQVGEFSDGLAGAPDYFHQAGQATRDAVFPGEALVLGASLEELAGAATSFDNDWVLQIEPDKAAQHVVFVDSRVAGYEDLLATLLPVGDGSGPVPVIDVVVLEAGLDGVQQMTDYLAERSGVAAVHVLAHGASGSLTLGATTLDGNTLDSYGAQLRTWGASLTLGADVLLYGCDVASGEWGADFVNNIARLTGADVAASDDATGNEVLGGDWDLELQVGAVESDLINSFLDVSQLSALLETPTITIVEAEGASLGNTASIVTADSIDLRGLAGTYDWTISAKGEITVTKGAEILKVQVTGGGIRLYAGDDQNNFFINNNAEFGSSTTPAQIIGNGTATQLNFTPRPDQPDAIFLSESGRVTANVDNLDLNGNAAGDPVRFGDVYFLATGISKFVGGKGDETVYGRDDASSILVGGRGDDFLVGGSQPGDLLQGGAGNDFLVGGRGSDFLEGGDGEDYLYGGSGDSSYVTPETGTDSLKGGAGNDSYFFFGNWGSDLVDEAAGGGIDTLDFYNVNVTLRVDVGVSALAANDGIVVTDTTNAANRTEAVNVEIITLGTAANSIVVTDLFAANPNAELAIANALNTTQAVQDGALASLDLSGVSTGVSITIEQATFSPEVNGTTIANPNGNKVTIKFESGAKLIVFNVKNITGTDQADVVTFEDGAVLQGSLDLGEGRNEVTVNGDLSGITGVISGGDAFDLLRIGSSVTALDSLLDADRTKVQALIGIIAELKGIANPADVDLATEYAIQLSANVLDPLALDAIGFEGVVLESGGDAGAIISGGDSRFWDTAVDDAKKDSLEGGGKDDILFGGQYDATIRGGDGNDIIVSGNADETLRGDSGSDVYVFLDNWGTDTITPKLTERAQDTLDFTAVTGDLTFILRAGRIHAGTGTSPDFAFNYDTRQFELADSSLTVDPRFTGSSNNVNKIKLSAAGDHTFEFGNEWNATTIDAPAGTNLVLDFSRVYETLRFDFKADGSLVVTKLGGKTDLVKDRLPKVDANAITITNVGANTTIITGSNENIYRGEGNTKFAGELYMTGGAKKIRIPLTESHLPIPSDTAARLLLGDVQHTIDLGQSIGSDVAQAQALWDSVKSGNYADVGAALLNLLGSRINVVSLAGEGGYTPLSFLPDNWITDSLTGLEFEKFISLNGAEIDNVVLNGLALNVAVGDFLIPGSDFGDNSFSTAQFQPGLHVLSGLTGADTYSFNNLWGLGLVLEVPDLDLGVALPESTDTLSFSGVYGQDVIVDVYDSIAAAGPEFIALLNNLGIDATDFVNSFTADDGSIISTNVVIARSVLPGTETTTSIVVANDIESLIGPSALGTMIVRMHGDATLRGTVAPGAKGDVVLDYSDYSGAVETRLETLNVPLGDFGATNIGIDLFFDFIDVKSPIPESTSGSATGIDGNRFGGLTTFYDFFADLTNAEQQSLLEDFGAGTVTKVIGSAFADTHTLSSVNKEYVIGRGDSILAPSEFDFFGLEFPDEAEFLGVSLIPDIKIIGETTLRFDATAASGVDLNLSTGMMTIDGVTSNVLSPSEVTGSTPHDAFSYIIYSGSGDDRFTGSSEVDTFIFEGEWGHDVINLAPGKTNGVYDVLDFSAVAFDMSFRISGSDVIFEKKDASGVVTSSVTVKGGVDIAGLILWPGIDDIVQGIGSLIGDGISGISLLAAESSAVTPLTSADVDGLLADVMQAFDGATVTFAGEAAPVTLAVRPNATSGTTEIVRTDTDAVVLDSSTFVFNIANLADTGLSTRDGAGVITLDTTAADNGWYLGSADPAAGETGIDLFSVLAYEVGLKLGLDASAAAGAPDFMNPVLAAGARSAIPADLGLQPDPAAQVEANLDVAAFPDGTLTAGDDLSAVVNEAINRWAAQQFLVAGAPWIDPTASLQGVNIVIDDLDGDELARTLADGTIVLDATAAGYGWFVDPAAAPADVPAGRMDLLTAIMHELGHKLGVAHEAGTGALMSDDIAAGERRDIPGGIIRLQDIDAAGQAALNEGLTAFAGWSDGLGTRLDTLLGSTAIPFTDRSLKDLLGITTSAESLVSAATTALQAAVANALAAGDSSAAAILAIDGSAGADFTYTIDKAANANPNSFVATFDLLPGNAPIAGFDLSSLQLEGLDLGFDVSTDLQLSANANLQLVVEFGLDADNAFYARSPELTADLELTSGAAGFGVDVTLGPLGLSVVDGSIDVSASTRIAVDGLIDTAGLQSNAIDTSLIEPETNGSYAVDLPIQLGGSLSGAGSDDVAIRASGILPTGPGNLLGFLQGMDIQFENFDQLFSLRGVSLDDLLNGIVTVIDALIQPDGLLYKTVPGINQSVADLLSAQLGLNGADLLGHIKSEIVEVQQTQSLDGAEDALNAIFNDLFGAGTDPVGIRLEDSVLILDLEFEKLLARFQQAFDLDLARFASELGLDALVGPGNVAAIADKLSIGSTGINLFADVLVGFNIGVGLDLRDITNPEQIISSDTGIFVRVDAGLDPVDFEVTLDISDINIADVLNLGGFDLSGLPLDEVGFGIRQATADLDVLLEFGLPDAPDGFYDIDAVPAAEIRASGQASIDLPLVLGTLPIGGSDQDLDGDGFADNVLHVGASFIDGDFEFDFVSPGMDQLLSLAGFLNDPNNVVKGLDKIFEVLENQIGGQLGSLSLPFIGGALSSAQGSIDDGVDGSGDDLREKVVGRLEDLIAANPGKSTIDLVAQALVEGLQTISPDIADSLGITLGGDFVEFNLELAAELLHEEIAIDLGLGDLISFGPDGKVMIDVGYTFAFGFGFSITDGFYLNTEGATEGGEEFLLDISATVAGLDFTGALPLLAISVKDLTGDARDNDAFASGILGGFSVDLQDAGNDGKLTIGEGATVDARLVAEANVDLGFEVKIGDSTGTTLFPTITTVFRYDQVLADIGTTGTTIAATPTVVFEDVELNLGEFITAFVKPIVDDIADVTRPLQPLVDMLNEPIALLDQLGLGDDITLLTLAEGVLGSSKYGPVVDAVEAISDVIGLVNAVDEFIDNAGPDPLVINFGSFTVIGGAAAPAASNPDPVDEANNAGGGSASGVVSGFSGGGFEFPLLTSPSTIFGLLLGEDVDLFIYNMPELDLNINYVKSFPIFPGLNARFGGAISASTNLSFGFDTSGFNEWKDGGFALADTPKVLEGFYISDNVTFDAAGNIISDLPEATVSAQIIAGASVGISGLVEAGVDGGIKGSLEFDLNDLPIEGTGPGTPNPARYDGKLRGDELIQRLAQTEELFSGFLIPCVFDIYGKVTFGLDAFFWVGADLGFLGKITVFEARKTFLSGTLASFSFECPDPAPAVLADLDAASGEVTLRMNTADGAFTMARELVAVDDGTGTGNTVDREFLVIRTGASFQYIEFDQVSKITAVGTDGDDQFVFGAGLDGIELDVDMRGGNDRIALASGGLAAASGTPATVLIRGGDGDDEIVVAENVIGNVDIYGDDDDDHIMFSSNGLNTIVTRGGEGNDTIIGSEYDDLIYGEGGSDIIYGFGGNDTIYGGDYTGTPPDPESSAANFDDIIFGGEGDDDLYGGSGDDRLFGEEGADQLYGEDGDDTLNGGLDVDEVFGGRDSDTIVWNYGDGEDAIWDGGDDESVAGSGYVDTVQLSGAVFDANGNTVAVDDRVSLSRAGATDNVTVDWARTGVAGSERTFDLVNLEQVVVTLGSGSDTLTVNDLDGTTVSNVNVNLGTTESIVEQEIENQDGEAEVFQVRNVATDAGTDILNLFGSGGADIYTVETTGTGLLVTQSKPAAGSNRNVLNVSIFNAENTHDRLNIDTGDDDDIIDASLVTRNDLTALGITAGDDDDIVIGTPFIDDIDSGWGNDRVTGGAGVDLFTDAGGDDKLFEARDVNFTLSDLELVVQSLGEGIAVEQPDGRFKVTRNVTGTEVEDISGGAGGIFEEVYLTGYNQSEGIDGLKSVNIFNIADFTGDAFLNGGAAADIYNIQLSGGANASFTSFIDVMDDGGADNAGVDVLNIEGTGEADLFHFAKDIVERVSSSSNPDALNEFQRTQEFTTDIDIRDFGNLDPNVFNVQTVNYLSTEDMVVHGRGGDDLFVVDDSSTELYVYGDSGDDSFFIGSVLAVAQFDNPNGGPPIQVVDRNAPGGGITNGVSFPAEFHGGKGNDYFEVNHNIAEISLYGEDGDDIFFLKALLTTEPADEDNDGVPDQIYQQQEDINVYSEAGQRDTLAYVNNAPVNIFGGEGFDTLVIVGTVIDDTFVIFTEYDEELGRDVQRIYGAGLVVPTIDSIERIQLITGAGDDTVYLYGTLNDQEILINTGSGNDLVQIGGDAFSFDVTIPESSYTKVNFIEQPDIVTTETVTTAARTWYTWEYRKLFGFFGPSWIPTLVRNFKPATTTTRIISTPQAPLEVSEVITVPEFSLEISVPESRDLDSISGPVFIDGQQAAGGDDAIVVDNRNGLTTNPGILQKTVVEAADINTGAGEDVAAQGILAGALPSGIDVEVIYTSVVNWLEDQNRVRQQGLLDGMLAAPAGATTVELRPGQRIQAFTALADLLGYLDAASATQGSYDEINAVTGVIDAKAFSLATLQPNGNDFLPEDVFTVDVGGDLGTVEVELLYDVNGDLIGANVFAEAALSFDISNAFVQSKVRDDDATRTYDALSGFGLGVGIFYENFSLVDIQLSNSNDVLTINDTTGSAITNVFAGGGDDRIEVNDTSGTLNLFGDVAGSDTGALGINSSVAGLYSEDFRDADNAAALGVALGLGVAFDADNIAHIRTLAHVLNAEFPATVNIPDPDNTIFKVINVDVADYSAQIWELLKSEINTLQGEAGDYRNFLVAADDSPFADFADDLGAWLGMAGTPFDAANRTHLAALAGAVNGKMYSLTVAIDLAGNANSLRRDLDVYSAFVSSLLGPDGLDIADGAVIPDYRDYLVELGEALELGQDFDTDNRAHLQLLASLVNARGYETTLSVDTAGTVEELGAAFETVQSFVWQTLKADLVRADGTPYNPLAETGDYTGELDTLGAILGLGGAFDPGAVADAKALGARLNDQFNDLGIDVEGIRLQPNIDLDVYELEIWKLITEVNELVPVPAGNDTFNIQRTGAEVTIYGQDGDDTVNLNQSSLGAWLTAMGEGGSDDFNVYEIQALTSASDRGDGRGEIRDSIDFDGGDGSDDYYVDLTGDRDLRVNVLDTGGVGEDDLTIDGTELADTFLLRRVTEIPNYDADQPAFVALVQGTLDEILANSPTRPDSYERVNYDASINGFLTVNGLAGEDYFAIDDNAARTVLDGGADNDTFQVGQVYRTARVEDAVDPADAFETVATTRGFLSRGVSYETTIIGGSEDDRVTVYSNQAELTLQGNAGNDAFEVRAFELADGSGFSTDSDTDIQTGDGDDTVQYNVNAPVTIDGGDGFDSIVVLGTESNDAFVITDAGVFGAGLTVYYDNAESVQVDGLEGDDSFFILSTAENVLTTVIGGLGSDTFNVGGDITEEIVSTGWNGEEELDHTLTGIQGPLVIEGHYLEGANRSLAKPVMLPGENNQAAPDGDVGTFAGDGAASGLDVMQIAQSAVAAVLSRLAEDDPAWESATYEDLAGLTLEITDGPGEGRFWSIEEVSALDADTFELTLRNPSVLESAGVADIDIPDSTSQFAISQLSANFFADEALQIDRLNVYNDGSLVDDIGTLQAIDGDNALFPLEAPINLSGLGMGDGFVADLGNSDPDDDIEFAGGITMDDLEILEILLGRGDDQLTIEDTLLNPENHGGLTIVHGGGGDDRFDINGGGGAASPLVVYGDTSQAADRYVGTLGHAFSYDNAGGDTINAEDADLSVTLYGGEGDDTITGGSAGDNLAGGSGNDTINGGGDTDLIYGDSGINVDPIVRILSVPTTNLFANPNTDDLAVGNDTLSGDDGEDVIFGDHGVIGYSFNGTADALWNTAHAGITGIRSDVLGEGGDDILYGNAGADILIGGSNTLVGGDRGGDAIDGGAGDDLIFGDNVVLAQRAAGPGQTADPRTRILDGSELYDGNGGIAASSPVDSAHPQVNGSWAEYEIVDLDHSLALQEAGGRNFGNDYLAGGADDDTIFGQLGNDVIQGDGGIGNGVDDRVGAGRDEATGALTVNASTEADTDGDDYIEGNGGDDVIFGNLGQDDIIGGSSSLFSLDDADEAIADGLRPDGSDTIFGGSGLRIDRNYELGAGDLLFDSPHANDADAIAGDNANIYRLVGVNGTDSGAFLTFAYDAGRGPERIIVRAVDLLDYTPGGADYDPDNAQNDIGAGDEIHGESGDDFIYGMKGGDYLYGDSEDDDIVAGYGNDWISGGSGIDGILGDDGRIYTGRNTHVDDLGDGELAEPLYGIEGLEETDVEISTPGDAQIAIIDKAGQLKKTANLTPFNVDDEEDNLYDAAAADDIIFGGIGGDFIHGGSGDDAISGAEAISGGFAIVYGDGTDANRTDGTLLVFGFDNPSNPGNLLGYSALRAGEFAEYDEFNPRQRIVDEDGNEHFLNFNANEGVLQPDDTWSDGDDVIFGDLGNDWLVGGTGNDNLYGGRGDDLLNADDDLGTNNGLNDTTDTSPGYADRVFGGAGRDVLIANTGADRLIDWAGEFNSYLVPFGIFGAPTISRAVPPALYDFLYDLSASDGADPTRGADEGSGADDPRNGEPFGELGLVTQKDFDWQAQTGAPADVQPGNIPGGERDVMQIATFNDGTADAFLADVGQWSVQSSRLHVEPEILGGDAVSVYYVNDLLPAYFELQATIQAGKPTAGYKSNAYLIFDYQSPTDFKFAGVNISTDKLEMGHRDETGWHVDVQLPAQLRPDRDYNLLLAINGTTATLLVNNKDYMTHTFEARVDEDGFSYGLNSGLVGIGAFNSKASIDNVKVQVLPKDVMPIRQDDFGSGLADFLAGQSVGQWSVADGYLIGSAGTGGLDTAWGGPIAYTTSDVRIAAGQILEIETTLAEGASGGIVFDQYGESDFKFVYIDGNGVVSVGHQSGSSWGIEASANLPGQVQGDYDIKVSLVGSTVNVIIDNQTVLSYAYNALTGDGAVGLLAAGDNVRFDDIVISTNDPAYLDGIVGDPLRAAGEAAATPGETLRAGADLQPLLNAAINRWTEQLGQVIPGAKDLQIWVTDLGGDLLGLTIDNVIYIDRNAAGLGWYVDPTPGRDEGFDAAGRALAGTAAANGVDLLSVISHEVGHVLGYDHEVTGGGTLGVGQRTLPDLDVSADQDGRERLREYRLRMAASQAELIRGFAPVDMWHRSQEVVNDLVASMRDDDARIVPVNLGMFDSVARQVPWAFDRTSSAGKGYAQVRAMLWNEEAGDFETAEPLRETGTDRDDVFEFLEDVGAWARPVR